MSCVNTKTKEFKAASIRNNINEAVLEVKTNKELSIEQLKETVKELEERL